MEDEVEAYMQQSTKAMKQGKSLLNSGHVHNVKFDHISTDLKYCFIHCRFVRQSAKTADWLEHNDVKWLVLHNCACAKKRSSK